MEVTRHLVEQAAAFADQYGLRGYDAVQLATAVGAQAIRASLGLPPLIFISADDRLNAAAQSEGMSVDNPNYHP
jgi:predicted nucleic acid-binding protein